MKISEWKIEDIGLEHSQYFAGRGIAYTDWDDVSVGVGSTQKDALDNALEDLAMQGYDIPADLEAKENEADDAAHVATSLSVILKLKDGVASDPQVEGYAELADDDTDPAVEMDEDQIQVSMVCSDAEDGMAEIIKAIQENGIQLSPQIIKQLEKEGRMMNESEHYYHVAVYVKKAEADELKESVDSLAVDLAAEILLVDAIASEAEGMGAEGVAEKMIRSQEDLMDTVPAAIEEHGFQMKDLVKRAAPAVKEMLDEVEKDSGLNVDEMHELFGDKAVTSLALMAVGHGVSPSDDPNVGAWLKEKGVDLRKAGRAEAPGVITDIAAEVIDKMNSDMSQGESKAVKENLDDLADKLLATFHKKVGIEKAVADEIGETDIGDVHWRYGGREVSALTPDGKAIVWDVNTIGDRHSYVLFDIFDENGEPVRESVSESGEKFQKLTRQLAAKGARDPKALAAWIGRKKLGKEEFQKKAATGKKVSEDAQSDREMVLSELVAEFGEEHRDEISESLESGKGRWGSWSDNAWLFKADGIEYTAFTSEEDAEGVARDLVVQELNDEPELFNQDFLADHLYVGDTDKRIIAGEEADASLDRDEKELVQGAGLYDEWLVAEDEEKDKIVEQAKEKLHAEKYKEVYDALAKDPIGYFVDDLGAYSREEALKLPFIQVNVQEAADAALAADGWAHFISLYDSDYKKTKGGVVYFRED